MIIKHTNNYHESIDTLPVYNWFKVLETDNLSYLKKKNSGKGFAPYFFAQIFENMVFSFKKLDLSDIRLRHKKELYMAQYLVTKKPHYKMMADELETQIKDTKQNKKSLNLSEFINYIEVSTSNMGKLDVFTLSTRRAYELHELANSLNVTRNKSHGNNRKN